MREAGVVGGGSAMGHTGTHSESCAMQRLSCCQFEATHESLCLLRNTVWQMIAESNLT
jgi:hypothetical protein